MLKSKTLWAACTAILGAIGGYFTGDLELGEMLQLIVTSGLAVFLRHGISKSQDAAEDAAECAADAANAASPPAKVTKVIKSKTSS
tara:strand:+ start:305 stop:562 length:258 start_codon:yes stop_codon:yes gene_type:complete